MTSNRLVGTAGAVLALLLPGPASATDLRQLIASAGLTSEQAAGMSLAEITVYKFDRDGSSQDRHVPVTHSTRGIGGPSLDDAYARVLRRTVSGDERPPPTPASTAADPAARSQLAAAAGFPAGVPLDALAFETFNRGTSGDELMPATD
jgi:hypothetical protein